MYLVEETSKLRAVLATVVLDIRKTPVALNLSKLL